MIVVEFFVWLFCLYWVHRLVHVAPFLKSIHWEHHKYITSSVNNNWHWSNVFLFNDNIKSTIDLWITEVVPTLLFCVMIGDFTIFVVYYIWAAFIQEVIEHNSKINLYPFLTSGRWHLNHHYNPTCNFGLFTGVFDTMFMTNKGLRQ